MSIFNSQGKQTLVSNATNTNTTTITIDCTSKPAAIQYVIASIDRDALSANDVHIYINNVTTNTNLGTMGWGVNQHKQLEFGAAPFELEVGSTYEIVIFDEGVVVENHLNVIYLQ